MTKLLMTILLLAILTSCTSTSDKTNNHQQGFLDLTTAKYDVVPFKVDENTRDLSQLEIQKKVFINPFKDSVSNEKSIEAIGIVVPYPPATKRVSWYYIGHAPMGSGILTVICEDNTKYKATINDPSSIAAVSSLLQAKYVRFDTISKEIYSYNSTLK